MKMLHLLLPMLISINLFACNSSQKQSTKEVNEIANDMKLRITIGQTVLTATMYDNPSAKDFISLLPLTLTLQDYAGTEKVSDLPKRLTTQNAPAGYKPSIGDITVYAPWGNLAIFYKGFSYSNGLILLGKIDGDMSTLSKGGAVQATIELNK